MITRLTLTVRVHETESCARARESGNMAALTPLSQVMTLKVELQLNYKIHFHESYIDHVSGCRKCGYLLFRRKSAEVGLLRNRRSYRLLLANISQLFFQFCLVMYFNNVR